MLNFALKGTFLDATGYSWDYYRDDQLDPSPDSNAFYIIPRPQFVYDANGSPSIGITTYQTDGADNGTGMLRFEVELTAPGVIQSQIASAIMADPAKFPGVTNPNFLPLALLPGSIAGFDLLIGSSITTFSAMASNFGSNVAAFMLHLSQAQLEAIKAAFVQPGGAFELKYNLRVPARLQGVSAVLGFDSSIAYQYQLTQPSYGAWGEGIDTNSVQNMLKQSASTTIALNWSINNPPQVQVDQITDWANQTIAQLVSAEVEKTINLQGSQSIDHFRICEVSSFTNSYAEGSVVDWPIQTGSTMPSFSIMGLNMADFEQTVLSQRQFMMVASQLPFAPGDEESKQMTQAAGSNDNPDLILIDSINIAVKYPTLEGGTSILLFKFNQYAVVETSFDPRQGKAWALFYNVNYKQNRSKPAIPQMNGNIRNINTDTYVLSTEDCGLLTVTFDARQAFDSEGAKPELMYAKFTYVTDFEVPPINRVVKFMPTNPVQTVNILQAFPINKTYNFQVTYVFHNGITYTAPLVQNQNGHTQILRAANTFKAVNLLVFQPADQASKDPLIKATVSLWYNGATSPPPGFAGNLPTEASPTLFQFTPTPDSQGNLLAKGIFLGLATADQPLMYRASIDFATSEQVIIYPQPIENTKPSILVSATQRYFTVEISPAAIDWDTASYSSLDVLFTPNITEGANANTGNVGKLPQRIFTWNKGEFGSKYLTIAFQSGNVVTYDSEVIYITPGQPVKKLTNTGLAALVFTIPAMPPE